MLSLFSQQCPDSACKQDLLAYLQRIALYCHQLNICSKVKAEVQNLGGELVVSGVSVSGEAGGRRGTRHQTDRAAVWDSWLRLSACSPCAFLPNCIFVAWCGW